METPRFHQRSADTIHKLRKELSAGLVLPSFLETRQTDSMMVISRGHVVFEYGDTKLVSKVASVRKSMLSLLYAVEMQKGLKFDPDQTVGQLGLEDKTPFIESERHATLQQLMMARSRIYIRSGLNPR